MSSLINLKLDSAKGSVVLNFTNMDSSTLRIVRYQATGITAISPLYISFTSGSFNTSTVIEGTNNTQTTNTFSTKFMLPVTALNNSSYEFNNPIVIMSGDNLTNASRILEYEVTDFQGNRAVFANLFITLDMIPVSRYNPKPGDRAIDNREPKEMVTRNELFYPSFYSLFDPKVPHIGYSNM